jgi:hypothetical protein
MRKELSKKLNGLKQDMTHDESIVADPQAKTMIMKHINQVDKLSKEYGDNPKNGVYRIEVIRKSGSGTLLRARKGAGKNREGFYIGHDEDVKKFIKDNPDIIFTNRDKFGF